MNFRAVRAIYLFEMARTWRTPLQSILSPVISTSLYFVVFGAAIGTRSAFSPTSTGAKPEECSARAAKLPLRSFTSTNAQGRPVSGTSVLERE